MMGYAGADAAGRIDRLSFKNFQFAKHAHNLTPGSKRAFSVFLDRAFDSGTALMLPATKTDLNQHQFSYVNMCVAEFYFAAAQVAYSALVIVRLRAGYVKRYTNVASLHVGTLVGTSFGATNEVLQ